MSEKKLLAKCIDNDSYPDSLTLGKIYEVKESSPVGDDKFYSFIDDEGDEIECWQSRFEVVEEEVKVTEFKTGDKVKVIGNSNSHRRQIGGVCYLVEPTNHHNGY